MNRERTIYNLLVHAREKNRAPRRIAFIILPRIVKGTGQYLALSTDINYAIRGIYRNIAICIGTSRYV